MYAATYIRERRIVLDEELLSDPARLRFILVHELFHFVWTRLSNEARAEFESLLAHEHERRARGEVGESSAVSKSALARPNTARDTKGWREYVCESFCDTAAWVVCGESQGVKLAQKWRDRREAWFDRRLQDAVKC